MGPWDEEMIARFLDALAAGTAEPGGGAAAALMAATGAALLSMACGLTMGRPRYAAHEGSVRRAHREAEALRAEALSLLAQDVEAYREVTAAYRLPRAGESAERQARIQEALEGATDVPLRIAALAGRIVELSAEVVDGINRNAAGDLAVGVLATTAALNGAALTVKINLAEVENETFTTEVEERLERTIAATRPQADRVLHTVEGHTR